MQDSSKFILSKTGVKVYVRPEYHPALKGTDLLHPDFRRKAGELFGGTSRRDVIGLPRICSENSEDAQTWHYFSPLLSTTNKKKAAWLKNFLTESLGHPLDENLNGMLSVAELMFWRGKKEKPFYSPPPTLSARCPEGKTEVDLTISLEKAVVFVETKYKSEVAESTTHCRERDQIIRNIDVGTYYAWNKGLDFYFILVASPGCRKSMDLLQYYRGNPQAIAARMKHRTDVPEMLEHIRNNLGLTTWNKLRECS